MLTFGLAGLGGRDGIETYPLHAEWSNVSETQDCRTLVLTFVLPLALRQLILLSSPVEAERGLVKA